MSCKTKLPDGEVEKSGYESGECGPGNVCWDIGEYWAELWSKEGERTAYIGTYLRGNSVLGVRRAGHG